MAEITRQRIKSIYSEIEGYINGIPDNERVISKENGRNYNQLLVELTKLTETDFLRYTIKSQGAYYMLSDAKMSMSAVANRLRSDYNFYENTSSHSNPVVINVNQSQQMTVNVTTIQELIESQPDEEIKKLLISLSEAINSKNSNQSRNILSAIGEKSWEVFIKVLPYLLEKWAN